MTTASTMAGMLPSSGAGLVLQVNYSAGANGSNGTDHGDCGDNCIDVITYPAVQAFFCILYTTIFVLGVFGNVLVCYVVGRNRAMQTVTNFFITNLALSDILLCILAVPFTPLYSFVGRWVFGQVMCHLVTYSQGTSVYISTLTLTSIAIDRYFVIIYPFQPRMKQSTCLFIILGIWTFSLAVTVPYGLFMSFSGTYCEEDWPSENFRQIYSGVTTVLQFLVPLVVIAFAYICVSVRLSDHARLKPGCKSSRKEEADRERKRRTNRMLIAMVTVFGMSWMPLNVINLMNDIHSSIGNWPYYNLVFFMVHALAMSSTCYNPFLYAWLNDNFRKEFKQVLPCFVRFGLSQPGCGPGSANTQSTAPWRSEAACNGGTQGAPPRTASARAGQGGGGPHHGHGHGPGPEAHDALLPAAPRRPRSEDTACTATAAPPPASATKTRASRASQPAPPQGQAASAHQAQHQLRGKRKDPSTSSPTTEAVSWTGACMGSSTNLGDLVTATYSTEDGSVEVHLPLEAVVQAANSASPSSTPGAAPAVDTPTGTAGTACSSIAVAPPERPLISISPESSPRNHGAVSRTMSGAASENGANGTTGAAGANGTNGGLRLLAAGPGSATVA